MAGSDIAQHALLWDPSLLQASRMISRVYPSTPEVLLLQSERDTLPWYEGVEKAKILSTNAVR